MSSVLSFWEAFLPEISSFLMSEPIIYFVGMFILLFIVCILRAVLSFK